MVTLKGKKNRNYAVMDLGSLDPLEGRVTVNQAF